VRLQADAEAGLLPGVEILSPFQLQAKIQLAADELARRPVNLFRETHEFRAAAREYRVPTTLLGRLVQRFLDMFNAQRHHEWLIRGVIPARYITFPREKGHP